MNVQVRTRYVSKWGLLFLIINIILVAVAHFVPGILGGSRRGELENTRIEALVVFINYPVFWTLQAVTPKNISANLLVIGLSLTVIAVYWYCEGMLIALIIGWFRRFHRNRGDRGTQPSKRDAPPRIA